MVMTRRAHLETSQFKKIYIKIHAEGLSKTYFKHFHKRFFGKVNSWPRAKTKKYDSKTVK